MGRNSSYEEHSFYCINCGNKGISLQRRTGFRHADNHRKKLYCIYCKTECNHIECKTLADEIKFKEDFENGVYIDEAKESVSFGRSSRQW